MKRITASEARRNWFKVLDRVAAGEVMMIERNGRRIVLQRQDVAEHPEALPDYSTLIRPVVDANRADDWSWEWTEDGELRAGGEAGA